MRSISSGRNRRWTSRWCRSLGVLVLSAAVLRATTAAGLSYTVTELHPFTLSTGLVPRALNDSGQITGDATMADLTTHAFRWTNGVATDLGTLGGDPDYSYGVGINSAGDVVGTAVPGDAFLYSGGVMTPLGTVPGEFSSEATGINMRDR